MDARDPRKDAWWIGISYAAMLVPCVIFLVIARRFFNQPWVFALGVPAVTYILLVISMTIGYMKYYSTPSPVMKSDEALNLILPFVSAALLLAVPGLLFGGLAIYFILQGRSFLWTAAALLVANLLAITYLVRVSRLKRNLWPLTKPSGTTP